MKVTFELRNVLVEHGLSKRGVIKEISAYTGIDRRQISKLLNEHEPTLSLDVVSKVCSWLMNKGVDLATLPGSLFGLACSELMPAIAQCGRVDLHLGEYLQVFGPSPVVSSVSLRDAAVAADFIRWFSAPPEEIPAPQIQFQYTPLQYPLRHLSVHKQPLVGDIAAAAKAFQEMRRSPVSASSILIGSQRVNYLLEHYVADLFGCQAFETPASHPRVPFFLVYRRRDHQTPSCFGGPRNPFSHEQVETPGLHYISSLRGKGRWRVLPWDAKRADGGLVIIVEDKKTRTVEVAIAGFSGRATQTLGQKLILDGERFWPPPVAHGNKNIGVYICRLEFEEAEGTVPVGHDDTCIRNWDPLAMDERILEKFLP